MNDQTKTFTLLVTIDAAPGHMVFDTRVLADAVQAALECGQKRAVIKGVPDVKVESVYSATVDAFMGDKVECPAGTVGATAAQGVGSIKKLHASMRGT